MLNTASLARRRSGAAFALFLMMFLLAAFGHAGAQQLRMIAPAGGENFLVDSTYNIRWLVQGVTGTLRVEYSIDSGATWKLIDTVTAAAGADTLTWKVPNEPTDKGMMRVWKSDSVKGVTRRVFHIVTKLPAIVRVLAPNGGELYAVDSLVRIRWTTQNLKGTMTVSYSADSGKTWKPVGSGASNSGQGEVDTVIWKVPNDTTRTALVRVATDDGAASDVSDRVFTIKGEIAPKLRLISPNGGEVYATDSTMTIRWTGQDLTGTVRVEFSPDSGATWSMVGFRQARNGNDSTTWKINANPTTKALMRVMLGTGAGAVGTVGDSSDALFTIGGSTAPPDTLVLIYPDAGGIFAVDSIIQIRWLEQGLKQNVLVSYSVDGGLRWTQIASVPPQDGLDSLAWTVPVDTTSRAYIRLATVDQTRLVKSAVAFSIVPKKQDTTTSAVREPASLDAGGAASSPNPTTGRTEIRWAQTDAGSARLDLYGPDGRVVRSFDAGRRDAGEQSLKLDLADLPPGAYRMLVIAAGRSSSVPVVIVR
jgi:hypothetical protein